MSSGESRHTRWFRALAYVTVFTVMTGVAWCIAYARWRTNAIANVRKSGGEIHFAPLPEFAPKSAPVPEWSRPIDSVTLVTCGTTDDSLRKFAGSRLTDITTLDAFGPRGSPELSDAGLEHLGKCPLEKVDLWQTRITGSGFRHLRECPLRSLSISHSPFNDAGMAELAHIPTLELVALHGTKITDVGLAELKALPALKHLHVSWNDIKDDGLAHLAELKLESLSLDCTYVTDAGLRHLTKLPLRKLSLCQTEVTPAGLRVLSGIESLEEVVVFHSRFTDDAIDDLRAKGLKVTLHNYGGQVMPCERVSWIDVESWLARPAQGKDPGALGGDD